jgi:hypothetical protein
MSIQPGLEASNPNEMIDAWKCPECGYLNDIRHSCLRCGRGRPTSQTSWSVDSSQDEPASRSHAIVDSSIIGPESQSDVQVDSWQDEPARQSDSFTVPVEFKVIFAGCLLVLAAIVYLRVISGNADRNLGLYLVWFGLFYATFGGYDMWRAHRRKNSAGTDSKKERVGQAGRNLTVGLALILYGLAVWLR